PSWPSNGRDICIARNQGDATMVSDGGAGAIVAWEDDRNGPKSDIYAQHVLASGSVDPAWPVNGQALCAAGPGFSLHIVADGDGGAIVTWVDQRIGSNDIYAQHVFGSGVVNPSWPADGRAVCTAAGDQGGPAGGPAGLDI